MEHHDEWRSASVMRRCHETRQSCSDDWQAKHALWAAHGMTAKQWDEFVDELIRSDER